VASPAGLQYSKEHEWLKVDGETALVGITDHAQHSLGDIVYVELPRVGSSIEQFASVGVVESVKAVSDLFTPVGGEVLEVNAALEGDPALVNRDAYGEGWLFKVKLGGDSLREALLEPQEYDKVVSQ